jgi:tryptophanyl-tRNA synthetase
VGWNNERSICLQGRVYQGWDLKLLFAYTHHFLHGTDGSDKMSSSKENYIAIDDEPDVIKKKFQKSFCPQGLVEGKSSY